MSSAGHVLDMIKRSRYNDSIRKKRIERVKNIKELYQEEIRKHNHIDFKRNDISKAELDRIKTKVRNKVIIDQRKSWLLTSVATILSLFGIYHFIRLLILWT